MCAIQEDTRVKYHITIATQKIHNCQFNEPERGMRTGSAHACAQATRACALANSAACVEACEGLLVVCSEHGQL
jgi:hypothetical protein